MPPENLTEQIWSFRTVHRRFQAACEYAPKLRQEKLMEPLRCRHGELRFPAVRELARRREPEAVKHLLGPLLRKNDLPAIWALGEIGDQRALRVFEILLEYGGAADLAQDSPWHGAVVRALARYGDSALPMLEKALASKEYPTKTLAISTLGLIGSDRARRVLDEERVLAGGSKWECREIDEALGVRADRRPAERVEKDRLLDALSNSSGERRRAAIDLLVEYGARDRLTQIAALAGERRLCASADGRQPACTARPC